MTFPRNTVTGALQKRRQRRSRKRHQTEAQLWAAGPPGEESLVRKRHRMELCLGTKYNGKICYAVTDWCIIFVYVLALTHKGSSSSVSSKAFSVSRLSSSTNCSPPLRLSSSSSLKKNKKHMKTVSVKAAHLGEDKSHGQDHRGRITWTLWGWSRWVVDRRKTPQVWRWLCLSS